MQTPDKLSEVKANGSHLDPITMKKKSASLLFPVHTKTNSHSLLRKDIVSQKMPNEPEKAEGRGGCQLHRRRPSTTARGCLWGHHRYPRCEGRAALPSWSGGLGCQGRCSGLSKHGTRALPTGLQPLHGARLWDQAPNPGQHRLPPTSSTPLSRTNRDLARREMS